jgi:indolepyruvate ferredoxin oxidoreductase
MGGEGVPWVGMAPFVKRDHIFANLGDGTYFHSGTLAIRAAVASKVNITYKILYNDAVAMTGGQHVDGDMPVYRVAQQVVAEGVAKTWILTETLEVYNDRSLIPAEVVILHRDYLDSVMKECQQTEGTTVIIYDQTCAAEKRRRRKRGKFPDPNRRVVINKSVCEGCGDCSVQSNCVAVQPVETEYGRKRKINQSMCNKDFSCVKGFCPSFVSVIGGELKKTKAGDVDDVFAGIPDPKPFKLESAYNIMVTGIGGTGVLTVGALLGMAAHLEGKLCRNLDMTGLAQKGGEVLSHVRISPTPDDLRTGHIITGGADLLIACDMVAAVGPTSFETLSRDRTRAVVNINNTPVADFVINNNIDFHQKQVRDTLLKAVHPRGQSFTPASEYATVLMGDEIATNIFMVGFAWQQGLIPLSKEAIFKAIEINGVAIPDNIKAFNYGRLAAHDPEKIQKLADAVKGDAEEETISTSLAQIVERRSAYLTGYQGKALADRYKALVQRVKLAEEKTISNSTALSEAVAKYYHKLLAYKDEYEVARLYTDGTFMKEVNAQFGGNFKLQFHMAPPILETKDPATGRPKKRTFGPWMLRALSVLAKFKSLRGTPFDIFGYNPERKAERALIKEYEQTVDLVLQKLSAHNHAVCVDLLSVPEKIKGYGPVKMGNIEKAKALREDLLHRLENPAPAKKAA